MAGTPPSFYSTGPQLSLTITRNDSNSIVTLDGDRTMFSSKAEDELIKSDNCANGGLVTGINQPGGHTGSIEVERTNSAFSQFYAFLEQNALSGNAASGGKRIYCTMTATMLNPDGSGQYSERYGGVVFHGFDKGNWQRKDIVKPKVEFFASTCVPA